MKYRVLIEQDEDGAFVPHVPALPGCVSQGSSRDEALANIREAIEGYLESLREHDEPIPPDDRGRNRRGCRLRALPVVSGRELVKVPGLLPISCGVQPSNVFS
jgi:predicted RNase H-like HicB family nuclease